MSIRQITIIGTGLIGGSFALALKKRRFAGRIIGCDRAPVLERARNKAVIDDGHTNPADAVRGSQIIVLATPVSGIIDLIDRLAPALPPKTLLTDVGSTKAQVLDRAKTVFRKSVGVRFLAGHPMAGKEQSGVEFADPDLFQGAAWFVTPVPGQNVYDGLSGEYLEWVEKIGARIASSPYSMWRDIAFTNKKNIALALLKMEQHLAHIRENLDTRELAIEFEQAHRLRKTVLSKKKQLS